MRKNLWFVSLLLTCIASTTAFAAPEQSPTSEQVAQKVVQQFFTSLMKVDDVKGMKETVSFPFSSVFVSHTEAYPLQTDKTEAEFVERFSQFEKSFEGKPKSELEAAKKQLGQTTFSQFQTTLLRRFSLRHLFMSNWWRRHAVAETDVSLTENQRRLENCFHDLTNLNSS